MEYTAYRSRIDVEKTHVVILVPWTQSCPIIFERFGCSLSVSLYFLVISCNNARQHSALSYRPCSLQEHFLLTVLEVKIFIELMSLICLRGYKWNFDQNKRGWKIRNSSPRSNPIKLYMLLMRSSVIK